MKFKLLVINRKQSCVVLKGNLFTSQWRPRSNFLHFHAEFGDICPPLPPKKGWRLLWKILYQPLLQEHGFIHSTFSSFRMVQRGEYPDAILISLHKLSGFHFLYHWGIQGGRRGATLLDIVGTPIPVPLPTRCHPYPTPLRSWALQHTERGDPASQDMLKLVHLDHTGTPVGVRLLGCIMF